MAYEKREYVKFTTPKGTFKWPKLVDADFGTKQYPKPDGEYSTKLVLRTDDPATEAFIAKLQPLMNEAIANGEAEFKALKVETRKKLGSITVNNFYTATYDQETEELTGDVEFKFAMKAGGELKKGPKAGKRWSRKPNLFDAKGKLMTKAPDIWGGTIGKISFSVEKGGYFIPGTGAVGIKLSLEAAQVIDLVSGGARAASDYGFGEEEGYGYEEPQADEDDGDFGDESGDADGKADDGQADF